MKGCLTIKISENPAEAENAARWFHSKWGIPLSAYKESMLESLRGGATVPEWYLVMLDGRIIAGAGVIENDFHDRKDLTPNVCAVYVEEDFRRMGVARDLLRFICEDMNKRGVRTLYLITEHTDFYEKCGWQYLCVAQGDGEPHLSRMYMYKSK